MTADDATAVSQLDRLADELGKRASVKVVYGEPVTTDGVTVIPVAEVSYGFGGGAGPKAGAAETVEAIGAGGAKARPRGFIEIKNGTATYKPIRNPWLNAAAPLAALLTGIALPTLARRLTKRRLAA